MAVTNAADQSIDVLAMDTGGKTFNYNDRISSNDLNEAFSSIAQCTQGESSINIKIFLQNSHPYKVALEIGPKSRPPNQGNALKSACPTADFINCIANFIGCNEFSIALIRLLELMKRHPD